MSEKTPPNFLPTSNPFGLGRPPLFFLEDLHLFDPELVLFPSLTEPVFRVARRVTHTPGIANVLRQADTKILFDNRLVLVTAILPNGLTKWGPKIIHDLAERDVWRYGGPEAVANLLDRWDEERENRLRQRQLDEHGQAAHAAFWSLKLRTGSTVLLDPRRTFDYTVVDKRVGPKLMPPAVEAVPTASDVTGEL